MDRPRLVLSRAELETKRLRETARNRRDSRGRFLPGAPPGPGRPKTKIRRPGALRLAEALQAALEARLEADATLSLEDVVGAAELLLRRARRDSSGLNGS